MYNPNLIIPWGYQTSVRTLEQVNAVLKLHYHPEYIRRLLAWLTSMNGGIGIGGHFRPDGTQPDKPGFAPEGKSFHQNQQYNDGFIGACAVDVVAKNPVPSGIHIGVTWGMVPKQGTTLAKTWGVHANIDSEPWHIQPIEIDGWLSWKNAGSPAPKPNYPIPNGGTPSIPKVEQMLTYTEMLKTRNTAPPVAEVTAGRADAWLENALAMATLIQLTGSDEYDQAAADKLDVILSRKD